VKEQCPRVQVLEVDVACCSSLRDTVTVVVDAGNKKITMAIHVNRKGESW
jgi:hypothetical protein